MLALVERMPAGARLLLRTASTRLELDVDLTLVQLANGVVVPAVFELVVGETVRESVTTLEGSRLALGAQGGYELTSGSPTTIAFTALPGDPAVEVQVWLSHAATVTLRALRVASDAPVSWASPTGTRWVHYGSSISHCIEAAGPTSTWPAAVALRAGWDLLDLGLAGQCMLDPFVARTVRDTSADVISLKVGINVVNGDSLRERTFVPVLHGFLDTVRDGHPQTPILVVTPILCPAAEHAPGPTVLQPDGRFGTVPRPSELSTGALTLTRVRELIADVVTARQTAGDTRLHLLQGALLLGPSDSDLLYDGLHPSAAGYLLMADRFFSLVCGSGGCLPR
ncbi:MAG: GDSL-type esterase/lipase family protein [Actinomycetota bacterium]|nr:GDSL-type esterase/lipase family protein [Actinomycetota bacterium]